MQSIIEEIFNCNRGNVNTIKESQEYRRRQNEFVEALEKFNETLTKEQKDTLNDLFFMTCGLEAEHGLTTFKEGFKLGMLVAIEAFN